MTPVMNSKGIFKFKPPYDLRTEDIILEVIGIRAFRDLESEGVDVLELIYKKEKLKEEDYNRDKEKGELIVIFLGTSNQVFRIPTSYILDTPVTNGVFFKEMILTMPIGYVPLDYDLTQTLREVENTVLKGLGVVTECKEIEAGKRVVLTDADVKEFNQRVSSNRAGRNHTDYEARIRELEEQNRILREQHEALMAVFESSNSDPNRPLQTPVIIEPSALDKRIMTKKIIFEILAEDTEFVLSNLVFYKYLYEGSQDDNFCQELVPFRFSYTDSIYGFAIGVSEVTYGKMQLAVGNEFTTLDGFTDLPSIFSKNYYAQFRPGLAKFEILFEEPILLKGMTFNARMGTLKADRYRVRFENELGDSYIMIMDQVPGNGECGAKKLPISTTAYPKPSDILT